LHPQHQDIVLVTLQEYAEYSTITLSVLNQQEPAFIEARKDLGPYDKGTIDNEITIESIQRYLQQ